MMRLKFLSAVAAAVAALFAILPDTAIADDEMLVRQPVAFAQCQQSILNMLAAIKARPEKVQVEADTGAMIRVRLDASDANLVFNCSKSEGTIEVWRTAPLGPKVRAE